MGGITFFEVGPRGVVVLTAKDLLQQVQRDDGELLKKEICSKRDE